MIFFNKKNKKLFLKYGNEYDWMPPVIPTKNIIPEWYKNIVPVNTSNINSLPIQLNIKSCIPFLDTLTSGYIMQLPMDLAVKIDDQGFPIITWSDNDTSIVNIRDGKEAPGLPTPQGYSPTHFVWTTRCVIELPDGYSCLITHPLNRYDLPFITLSGIIDADAILHQGNIPFYIKSGFEGIIKAGTPMFQIILFKRENWTAIEDKDLFKKGNANGIKSFLNTFGWYKKNNWKRKIYN